MIEGGSGDWEHMYVAFAICHPWLEGVAKQQDRIVFGKELRVYSNALSKYMRCLRVLCPG